MRAVLLLVLCVSYSSCTDVGRCSNGSEAGLSLRPYEDGVVGRYLAEWCSRVEPRADAWTLHLWYFDNDTYCKHPPQNLFKTGSKHSIYEQDVAIDENCSYVCVNTTVDLIFSSCYLLKSFFIADQHMRKITQQFVHVQNNYTKELFFNNTATVEVHQSPVHKDGQNVTIVWHTGVPFTSYEDVILWRKDNISVDISDVVPLEASACSAPSQTEVRCTARLPPAHYHSQLRLHAPWEHGLFHDQGIVTYSFSLSPPRLPVVSHAAREWVWALGALVGTLALGGAACLACRRRDAARLHKHVLHEWLVQRSEPSAAGGAGAVKPPRRHIVLLYAREGPLAARFTAALKAMLEEAPDTQVYDIFSSEVMRQAAGAPGAWLRALLQRPDVAVLLVQTPALAALYHHQLLHADNTVTLQEPLLGRRVLYRAPQYGDSLLQYAVRLTGEAHHDYTKYYIATLAELPTEMFPALVPYRRYLLPGGAALLARDLLAREPTLQALDDVTNAATAFVHLAKDNPDYLMDELMLI